MIRRIDRRRGLAPLELVLWLPILLFVTALIVNFGTMVAWRTRGEIVARDAAWRTRWPRTGNNEPRPDERVWPADAKMAVKPDPGIVQLDDPLIDHAVVRGPLPNGFVVNPLVDPKPGTYKGTAEITRGFPMLAALGKYHSGEISHPLLAGEWQVAQMGIYTNETRRIPYLYELPKTDPRLPRAFVDAVVSLVSMVYFDALRVLDQDDEILRYLRQYHDFHPRIYANIYSTDPAEVRQRKIISASYPNDDPIVDTIDSRVRPQLGEISYLPRTMTEFFLNMYNAAIQQLRKQIASMQQQLQTLPNQITSNQQSQANIQNQISQLQGRLNGTPPPSPSEVAQIQSDIAALNSRLTTLRSSLTNMQQLQSSLPGMISQAQAEIATLEPKVLQLEAFLRRIPGLEAAMKANLVSS